MSNKITANEDIKYPAETYIEVIGVDNLQHVALPWSETTACGLKIKSKKVTNQDRINHLSCYECTY